MVFAVGLTGGIGCGKSSVAKIFAALGAAVIDTDEIAHHLTARGMPALEAIAKRFGTEFVLPDGNLDRARMRQLIFSDPKAKKSLEDILHPLIKQQVIHELNKCDASYALIVIPLLLETGNYSNLVARILVVDCEEDQQVARTMARSNLASKEVRAIMASQISRQKRLEVADDVIKNVYDLDSLQRQIEALHFTYMQLSQKH